MHINKDIGYYNLIIALLMFCTSCGCSLIKGLNGCRYVLIIIIKVHQLCNVQLITIILLSNTTCIL